MLVQSHNGCIEFLPALPAAWETGHFDGMRVQGGGEVAVMWADGKLKRVRLKALEGGVFRIKTLSDETGLSVTINGKRVSCPIKSGILETSLNTGDEMILLTR
jgi:alpha-L-fucosidase 2